MYRVYNVNMPVGKESKQITAVISADEYQELQRQVQVARAAGLKATMSKYVAGAVRARLADDQSIEQLFKRNGSQ